MKINQKVYNSITSEPFDVQELENGVVVELHSLNQNEALYNQYTPKAKFSIWTSIDSKRYRLLLEDTYYERLKELYGKRVNQCMITFWDDVERDRSKLMKRFFIPTAIVIFLGFVLLMIFQQYIDQTVQLVIMGATLFVFLFVNTFINKKLDSTINKHNSVALEKIKNIIGHKRFEELQEETRKHYDDFFGIVEEEKVEEVAEEKVEEEVTETKETEE